MTDPAQAGTPAPSRASVATFEGSTLDLKKGWSSAGACTSDGITTQCFRTESEMDQFLATQDSSTEAASSDSVSIQATCSSSVRLYDGTAYSGQVLNLSSRSTWLNLSTWSFSDRTSSYKIGSCSSNLADYTNGGGSWYPEAQPPVHCRRRCCRAGTIGFPRSTSSSESAHSLLYSCWAHCFDRLRGGLVPLSSKLAVRCWPYQWRSLEEHP
jgi:hypothetical protein